MSYKSRIKCDVRHIISCGLCHQKFNCPYDKEDKRVVFTKEHTGK
nr:MAG TPA: Cytochrome C' [Caudoviricetes sp.]